MEKIIETIRTLATKASAYIPKIAGSGSVATIVMIYFTAVCVMILAYFSSWCYMFYIGTATLSDLLALITEVTSSNSTAFLAFIAGCFVDLNHNGIPDAMEKTDRGDV